jgi:ATP-dependent helicase/nuclease subunit A
MCDEDGKVRETGYWKALVPFTKDRDPAPLPDAPPPHADASPPHADAPLPHVGGAPEGDGAASEAEALDVAAAARRRRAAIAARATPSHRLVTVSGAKDEADAAGPSLSRGAGYGPAFGTVVHDVLEAMVQAMRATDAPPEVPPPPRLRAALVAEHARRATPGDGQAVDAAPDEAEIDAQVAAAEAMLRRFASSPLAGRLRTAEVVYTEYPFAQAATPSGDEGSDGEAEGPQAIVRGVIDLVFRDAAGWHLVDYKTDRLASADAAASLDAGHAYARQVRTYARHWAALSGAPVARAALWFGATGTTVPVEVEA